MKEHVRKAVEVLGNESHNATSLRLALSLDAAGMLRTGLEQRAMDACEGIYERHQVVSLTSNAQHDAWHVGHEIAESRKPKERWEASKSELLMQWRVDDTQGGRLMYGTEAQCRAVAKALNDLERAR